MKMKNLYFTTKCVVCVVRVRVLCVCVSVCVSEFVIWVRTETIQFDYGCPTNFDLCLESQKTFQ